MPVPASFVPPPASPTSPTSATSSRHAPVLAFDPEWLAITRAFAPHMSVAHTQAAYPAEADARAAKTLKDSVGRLSAELTELRAQNDDLLELNNMLEVNSEKDRQTLAEYQRISESKHREALAALEKERETFQGKMQSERAIIKETAQSAYKTEKRISSSKLLVFEKQNEMLGAELAYYKKKVGDLEGDKRFLEDKIENYQKQLQIVVECVSGLEQRFALKESKLITDSQFETLKHSINFTL